MSDIPYGERGAGNGALAGRDISIPDLRIGKSPTVERPTIQEPNVVIPTELKAVRETAAADSIVEPVVQVADKAVRDTPEGVNNDPESKPTVELGGKVAVEGAFGVDTIEKLRPASPFAGIPQSPDEIPGQLELPFDSIPLEPGMYVQEGFDIDPQGVQAEATEEPALLPSGVDVGTFEADETSRVLPDDPVIEQLDVIEGEIVQDKNGIAIREQTEVPREVSVAQARTVIDALLQAAEDHPKLLEQYKNLWDEHIGILGKTPIHSVEMHDPETGDFTVRWRLDVKTWGQEIDQDGRVKHEAIYVSAASRRSFANGLSEEVFQAVDWLAKAAQGHGVVNKDVKDTPLVSVESTRVGWGKYTYDKDSVAANVSPKLAESLTKMWTTHYMGEQEFPHYLAGTRNEVEHPDLIRAPLPDHLKTIVDRYERPSEAGYIVGRLMDELRAQARSMRWIEGRPEDPSAFPGVELVRHLVETRYLLFPIARVEWLDKLNSLLLKRDRVVPRSFIEDQDVPRAQSYEFYDV